MTDHAVMGELLARTAESLGWSADHGEGAQEFLLRVCRETALLDAQARRGWQFQRYALLGGPTYYAQGGWLDLQGDFDDQIHAWTHAQRLMHENVIDWWQIVDVNQGRIVAQSEHQAHN